MLMAVRYEDMMQEFWVSLFLCSIRDTNLDPNLENSHTGGVLSSPQFLNSLGNPAGQYAIPMVASAYTLAAFFATPIVMVFGMRTGRKKLLLLGNILVVVGGAIQASSYSVAQISVARIICGFGIGFVSIPTHSISRLSLILSWYRSPQRFRLTKMKCPSIAQLADVTWQ